MVVDKLLVRSSIFSFCVIKMILFLPSALKSKNYQLFFIGQGISLIGTWMTQVSTIWLVYQLTHSAIMLGVVGFTGQIASFVFGPFGGVIVDRFNRHTLLITTQILAMIQSLMLATMALSNHISIEAIIILSFCQGLINAIDAPTRQTFVKDMIESPNDLMSAISLNSSLVTGARLIGPSLAGIVIARFGAGYCFLIDGLSYIAVIIGLLLMRFKRTYQPEILVDSNFFERIKEGFIYVFQSTPIRSVLLLMVVFSLMIMPNATLMPIFAMKILHGDAHTLGFLLAGSGVGALFGGIFMVNRKSIFGLERIIAFAPIISSIGLIFFSFSNVLWLSIPLLAIVGFGSIVQISSSNTLIQTLVDNDKRGRVMSIFTMAFLGISPFGALLSGTLANYIGAPKTLMLNGIICVVYALLFTRKLTKLEGLINSIFLKKGIVMPTKRKYT